MMCKICRVSIARDTFGEPLCITCWLRSEMAAREIEWDRLVAEREAEQVKNQHDDGDLITPLDVFLTEDDIPF